MLDTRYYHTDEEIMKHDNTAWFMMRHIHNLRVFFATSLTVWKSERAKEGERETDRGREGREAVLTYSSSFFASSGVLWSPDVLQAKKIVSYKCPREAAENASLSETTYRNDSLFSTVELWCASSVKASYTSSWRPHTLVAQGQLTKRVHYFGLSSFDVHPHQIGNEL